jgi:hypothetical protein
MASHAINRGLQEKQNTHLSLAILACPASEALVERIISICGWLTSGKRNKLSKTLEKKVLLKHSLICIMSISISCFTMEQCQ